MTELPCFSCHSAVRVCRHFINLADKLKNPYWFGSIFYMKIDIGERIVGGGERIIGRHIATNEYIIMNLFLFIYIKLICYLVCLFLYCGS